MAQAFVSTYKNNYRWNCQPKTKICDPFALTKLKPEGDIWLLDANEALERELSNIAKIEEAVKKLYLKRMKTTYQVAYCKKMKLGKKEPRSLLSRVRLKKSVEDITKIDAKVSEENMGNELLEYCKKLYGHKTTRITPPLNTARNIFGYMRPTRLLTPLTDYQNEYGRVGYNILEGGGYAKRISQLT